MVFFVVIEIVVGTSSDVAVPATSVELGPARRPVAVAVPDVANCRDVIVMNYTRRLLRRRFDIPFFFDIVPFN